MKDGTPGRTVSIVFREMGGSQFDVFLEGATANIDVQDPGLDLSPADFYASRMFLIVREHLRRCGVLGAQRGKG